MKNLFVIILLLNISAQLSHAQLSFAPIDTIKYNGGQYGVFSKNAVQYLDYNNNGNTDLLFIREKEIVLKLGLGDGTFGNEKILFSKTGTSIYSISKLVDLDGDIYLDLALMSDGEILILKGTEQGFTQFTAIPFDTYWGDIKWSDFNSDGIFDLIVTTRTSIQINYDVLNTPSTFEVLYEGSSSIYFFEFIDIDLDSNLDLVISSPENLTFYYGNANNEYTEFYNKAIGTVDIAFGDLSLDGYPDFIYAGADNNIYELKYDNSSRLFIEMNITSASTPFNLSKPTLIDIDNNNSLDIIFGYKQQGIAYLKNSGGSFSNPIELISTGTSSLHYNITYTDTNNDSVKDLILTGYNSISIALMDNTLSVTGILPDEFSPDTADLFYEDIDKDGFKDIIILSKNGVLTIRWGSLNNDYQEKTTYTIPKYAREGICYDLNKDGNLDIIYSLVTPNNGINTVYVIYGNADRTFQEPINWRYMPSPSKPMIADLDNNGEEEIVFFSNFYKRIAWFNPLVTDYDELNNNNTYYDLTLGDGISSMEIVKLDNNDSDDIIVGNSTSKSVSILLNDGVGNFSETSIILNKDINTVRAFDYDFDGILDLLITTTSSSSIESLNIYLGDGNGSFSFSEEIEIETYLTKNIEFIDLENDGDTDIIVSGWDYLSSQIFINTDNLFELSSTKFANNNQVKRIFRDLNQDGLVDAISSSLSLGNLYQQLNNSVIDPVLGSFKIDLDKTSYDSIYVLENGLEANGYFVIVKEGANATLTELPINNTFYVVNEKIGNGSDLGGGSVVYSGTESSFQISGLKPNTPYTLFAFTFNMNSPNNSIIRFSLDYITLDAETTSSLFLVQNFGPFEVNEDASLEINLDQYINNIGDNSFSFSTTNTDISFDISNANLTISASENYFGSASVNADIANSLESRSYTFDIGFLAVNDAPEILSIEDQLFKGFEAIELNIEYTDIDNDIAELTVSTSSTNLDIIKPENISITKNSNGSMLSLTPTGLGETIISINVSDGELNSSTDFNLTISEVLGFENQPINVTYSIFPNPTQNELFIEHNAIKGELNIYNSNGILVVNKASIPIKIDVSNFPVGQYLIKIGNQSIRFNKK